MVSMIQPPYLLIYTHSITIHTYPSLLTTLTPSLLTPLTPLTPSPPSLPHLYTLNHHSHLPLTPHLLTPSPPHLLHLYTLNHHSHLPLTPHSSPPSPPHLLTYTHSITIHTYPSLLTPHSLTSLTYTQYASKRMKQKKSGT